MGRVQRGVAIAVVGVWLAACGPSVPSEIRYRVELREGDSLVGNAVSLDGAPAGVVAAGGYVELTVAAAIRPSSMRLGVAMTTPCGPRESPVAIFDAETTSLDDTIARGMAGPGFVLVRGGLDVAAIHFATVLVDRDEGDARPITIGEATVPAGARVYLVAADCGPTAPVRVGDETIGTWHAADAATLISTTGSCHQDTAVGYGNAVTGPPVVFGQRVRGFDAVPDHFLERAPSSIGGTGARYVHEVVRASCPTGESAAAMAARAQSCVMAMPWLSLAIAYDQDDVVSAVHFLRCTYTETEAQRVAGPLVARHPEARDEVIAVMNERAFSTAAL